MPETSRRPGASAAWGVVAGILGSGASASWIAAATSGKAFPTWPAWTLSGLTLVATYLCFALICGWWLHRRVAHGSRRLAFSALRRRVDIVLVPEQEGANLRLLLQNNGRAAEFSAQVIAIRDPLGRASGPQHWTIPWLDDSSTEPKRVLCGQTRILDFARYRPDAVKSEIDTGRSSGSHWRFPTAPSPIEARYYNIRNLADLDTQRFLVTVRLLNAYSGSYTDQDVAVGITGNRLVCEAVGANIISAA